MERRFSNTEVRATEQTIEGVASVFYDGSERTEYKLWQGAVERIAPSAFDRAIKEDHDARALYNHEPDNLLGRVSAGTLKLSISKRGLEYSIPYDAQDPDHQRVKAKIKRGDLTGSSFAFRVTGEQWSEEGGVDVRTITDLQLIDVSPTVYPAYESSSVGMRASDSADDARLSFESHKRLQNLQQLTT